MPEGGTLTIHTSLVRQVPPGLKPPNVRTQTYVRLAVTDSGPGMPSGARFRVLRPSPLRKEHGTELAMAVVGAHDAGTRGHAAHRGDDGQGSRVSIDLPCLETMEPG
jgi:signal transduction histidine kinase